MLMKTHYTAEPKGCYGFFVGQPSVDGPPSSKQPYTCTGKEEWGPIPLPYPSPSSSLSLYSIEIALVTSTRLQFDSAARAKELLFGGRNESPINKSWDCFLGAGLSNLEYGYLCEIMGRSVWATQVFNCGAPDTGNMEVLLPYGNKKQLQEWLIPLLEGKIQSGFAMTEPQVASSDATNIECSIERKFMASTFEITYLYYSGKIMMVQRALKRSALGKLIAKHGSFLSDIAKCRIDLEQTRLLVLEAADQLDGLGNKEALGILAMAKVAAPNLALKVLDMAMQVHGAVGLLSDTILAHLWATARTLRLANGPDEVHLGTIAKLELRRAKL
ncbi:hypothetical protein RHMOL_Rhmol04G0360900 [Rhododendron molle]|uniref:Uncharacterized protein n=1 Tax=Rhododendron molle TaxID=49168 RepID=A0ACC0P865_RHOML|nr:hypothetical protein RHMOL_Rhmol04G0360900 [Rhododendron molle]